MFLQQDKRCLCRRKWKISDRDTSRRMETMLRDMPLRGVLRFSGGTGIEMDELKKLVEMLNA